MQQRSHTLLMRQQDFKRQQLELGLWKTFWKYNIFEKMLEYQLIGQKVQWSVFNSEIMWFRFNSSKKICKNCSRNMLHFSNSHGIHDNLTLTRLLRRKLRIGPHWPPSEFWWVSFGKYQFKLSKLTFSVGFISRSCFKSDGLIAYSNEWDWREKKLTNL